MNTSSVENFFSSSAGRWTGAVALFAAASALWVAWRARRAEREHPPRGQFVDVDGGRLHYVSQGEGPPVVLIHGNVVSLADFQASGLIDRLAQRHRVLAFDRPGLGHSSRPRNRLWTPKAQAAAIHQALRALGVERPVVVGHSMGTLVALALALDHPGDVSRLVLLGGYYYPNFRLDALLTAPVALPVLGDVLRYTVTALAARLMLRGMVKGMFSPQKIPDGFFRTLSREMMVRPGQLRANAEDAAFMIPAAKSAHARYQALRQLPITLIAGSRDKVVNAHAHSGRLHRELPSSVLWIVPGAGHMVHYDQQEAVIAAVEGDAAAAQQQQRVQAARQEAQAMPS